MSAVQPYVGRFAPSPSGPLHFGSLVAALAAYLDARANKGKWLLRIEDLDPPRESPTAATEIINQLHSFGFDWDEIPLYQSTRLDAYAETHQKLTDAGMVYQCICSRKSIPSIYGGTCRNRQLDVAPSAIRLLTPDAVIAFEDQILGRRSFDMRRDIGDFIIKRKDGLFAYQLAVVVDDQYQGITHVIRGSDLLDSTPRQICLQQYLNFRPVFYAHFPVILGNDGHKLSKQTNATPITTEDPPTVIKFALRALGQMPVKQTRPGLMLRAAVNQWSLKSVPAQLNLKYSGLF